MSALRRIVVQESVYHCDGIDADTVAGKPWSIGLKSDEAPYAKRYRVSGSAPLDYGWVSDPLMLLVENRGKGLVRLELDGAVLSSLPPNTSSRIMVAGLLKGDAVLIGEATVYVTVYPS